MLLFVEFQRTKEICHEIIWSGFKDWIEILVRRFEIALRDVDVGAAQMGLQVFGIDLERLVEKTHGPVEIAPDPQHFTLDLENFRRVRIGSDRLVD